MAITKEPEVMSEGMQMEDKGFDSQGGLLTTGGKRVGHEMLVLKVGPVGDKVTKEE